MSEKPVLAAIVLCLAAGGCASPVAVAPVPAEPVVAAVPTPPETQEARIERLIGLLGSAEYGEREHAEAELKGMGFPAFGRLRKAADNPDLEIAQRARRITGPYDRIMQLLDALPQDWHTTLYYDGLTATQRELAEIGPVAVPYIRDRIACEDRALYRFNCATVLNALDGQEPVKLLRELASDKDPWCRVESIWALGNAGDRDGLAIVAAALNDQDKDVRKEALIAVGKIAGIRVFGFDKGERFLCTSAMDMPEEGRTELERVVKAFMEQKKLPAAVRFGNAPQRNLSVLRKNGRDWEWPDLDAIPELKGDWKAKSFESPNGKELWVLIRYEKRPVVEEREPPADEKPPADDEDALPPIL